MPPKLFRKQKTVKKVRTQSSKPQLRDVVKSSYGHKSAIKKLENLGFQKDSELSNHNQSVFYSPEHKKAIVSIAGTHNMKDIMTDIGFAFTGNVKNTDRYKEAEETYRKTRGKYKPESVSIVSHSLGGAVGSELPLLDPRDRIVTYNKASHPLFSKTKPHEINTRAFGDLVSLASKFHPRTITFSHHQLNPLGAHSSDALKDLNFEL